MLRSQRPAPDSTRSLSPEAVLRRIAQTLEPEAATPLYRQISLAVETEIERGELQPGDRLPSERRLIDLFGISRSTIRIALGELIGRGYLAASHGRGNFVQEPPQRRELRFLALERIGQPMPLHLPGHYDLVHAAEQKTRSSTHYRHTRTVEELLDAVNHPSGDYDGILIFRPHDEWEEALLAAKQKPALPLLVVNRDLSGSSLSFISVDHYRHGLEATRHLIAQGHRRIGYLSGDRAFSYVRQTEQGYRDALAEAGLPFHPQDVAVFHGFETGETVVKGATSFLANRPFTALVTAGSFPTLLLKEVIVRGDGPRVPEELAVCRICEPHIHKQIGTPSPAFVYPDHAVIARSIQALGEMARGNAQPPVQELLPPQSHVSNL